MSITGFRLELSDFSSFPVTLSGIKAQGEMDKIGDTVGVYMTAGVSGGLVAFLYEAEAIRLPKDAATGISFTKGAAVYYDGSAKKVTNAASGNIFVGIALEDKGATDTDVLVDFEGTPARAV